VAELAAVALLAEEEAGAQQGLACKKKASKKSKSKPNAASKAFGATEDSLPTDGGAAQELAEATAPDDESDLAPLAAADNALRVAMAAAQYEGLARALEEHHTMASEGVLAEAKAMRDRLHKKRKQASRKLRLAHAAEMQVQASLSELSIVEAPLSAPAAAAGSAIVAATPAAAAPEAAVEPLAAVALTLDELALATGGFAEQKLIGSGGYGRVFAADALPSLPPEKLPPRLRHLPVAVKRAKTGVHNLDEL